MTKPIEQLSALTVGTVESVSPSEIRVVLEPNAPQATALNTGVPAGFPRINGYLLIPNEAGAVVGLIVWLGVERSQFPKRTGLKDYGLVDLPFPLRKIALTPLGTLVSRADDGYKPNAYKLERGILAFPSVSDVAQLPTSEQMKCIIEASDDADRRVKVGVSPLAADSDVTVDPNKIFGRHLAVLGNTGSGKSCSVAGLIRWSLDAARKRREEAAEVGAEGATEGERGEAEQVHTPAHVDPVNARFIILDPNGEYSSAFADYPDVRLYCVPPAKGGAMPLSLPAWVLNSQEWCAFTEAKSGVQRPILMRALRELRAASSGAAGDRKAFLRVQLRSFYRSLVCDRNRGAAAYMDKPGKGDFGQKLHAISSSLRTLASDAELREFQDVLLEAATTIRETADARHKEFTNDQGELVEYYVAFDGPDVERALEALDKCVEAMPDEGRNLGINEDSPIRFDTGDFIALVEQIAAEQGQSQYVDTLVLRIRMLLSDMRLSPILTPAVDIPLEEWLNKFVGDNGSQGGALGIIDLSLISSDVLHLMIAVIARIVFEAMQRYRRIYSVELPTVLVLEEAHTFVKRWSDEDSGTPSATQMCRQTFERIAREGRKFGLGLVLSSQRPSELSPTVLAQCNTFLLHRIVNDRDQELVGKLVPDNLGGLLKELPSLPTRHAVLLGWAVSVPTLVEIAELPEAQRPCSPDPEFWDVWTGREEREINWERIVEDWTGVHPNPSDPPAGA